MSGLRTLLTFATAGAIFAASGFSQDPDPAAWQNKLHFHAAQAYGPDGLAESIAFSGYLQVTDSPREWGRGGVGYGKRLGSTLAYSGVRNVIGFGLDTALHQDPHYYRSTDMGFCRRLKHAFRGTILTRRDSGGETFATWRFGSAYGAAFLTNEWHPDRVSTVRVSLAQGSTQIAFDLLSNIGTEFWPDVKKKILRRSP